MRGMLTICGIYGDHTTKRQWFTSGTSFAPNGHMAENSNTEDGPMELEVLGNPADLLCMAYCVVCMLWGKVCCDDGFSEQGIHDAPVCIVCCNRK